MNNSDTIKGYNFPNKLNPIRIKTTISTYGDFNKNSCKLLLDILTKDSTISYLSYGNSKIVYKTADDNKVFKISILNNKKYEKKIDKINSEKKLDKMIREPLYMLKNKDICNPPSNICVYIDSKRSFEREHVSVNKIYNINNTCIITWYEERTFRCAITPASTPRLQPLDKANIDIFVKKTKSRLINDKFIDIRSDNVGIFPTSPKYRWFDLMPAPWGVSNIWTQG